MADKRQLLMRRDMTKPLKPVTEPAYRHSVHADDGSFGPVWEEIVSGAFGCMYPYEQFLRDEGCTRDRVFFSMMHSQEMGTCSAELLEEKGIVHMLAVHPYGQGCGLGRLTLHAALECIRDSGKKIAELYTDDHRLAAIRLYLEAGFEPVIEDEEMEARWKDVNKRMSEYVKTEKERIILWPEGNIPYFREENCIPAMTAYPIEGSKGAVVVCPGGGYTGKAAHEGGPIAEMLNEAGISAYVLDYRVKPCHYNAPVSDAHRAIRTLRHMGYEKVGILGFSAGGHLTCSAATLYDLGNPDAEDPIERQSCRPDAFIPCYAVVSFISFRHQGSVNSLLGEEKENWELIYRFSAEMHVDKNTPPAFIWHTAEDAGVPVENSLHLARAMAHAGVPYELHIFPNGGHGLGLAQNNSAAKEWGGLCQKWLLGLGFGKN